MIIILLLQLRHLKQEVGNLPKVTQFINKCRHGLSSEAPSLNYQYNSVLLVTEHHHLDANC